MLIDRNRYPADPWRLIDRRRERDAARVDETLFAIGNGYLGMRANAEDGRFAHEHGTFINGFHETWRINHAEQAFGFAEVGQTILSAPDAKIIRLYVDDEPLGAEHSEFLEYEQELDLRAGVFRRRMLWRTPSGKRVRVTATRMVSFVERHLALLTFEVELLDAPAPVTISSQLMNRQDEETEFGRSGSLDPRQASPLLHRVLVPGEHWQEGPLSALSYRVAESGMRIGVVTHEELESEAPFELERSVGPDLAKNVYLARAQPGQVLRLTKFVSYHTSERTPTRQLLDRCQRTLRRAVADGPEYLHARQRAWLDEFWARSDVRIPHDDRIQQAVRWNLFQLAQASARADGLGIAAKGVTGSGYSGHYFWDGEIYALPFLTYTDPVAARNALGMRQAMLPAARRRAQQLSEEGALFPWRTINGEEASAYYAAGTAQYHINADVTYALAKYLGATGDLEFLADGAIDIAVETARLWRTLGFWRAGDAGESFHIHGVTGPDEYTTVVNDNLYTNVMARFNLRFAAYALGLLEEVEPEAHARAMQRLALDPEEPAQWRHIADAIHIPFAEHLGVHPQDEHFLEREVWDLASTPPEQLPLLLHFHPLVIYRFQVLKQADVVLALLLQGDHFTAEQKRADFEYYDPLTTGDSSLSAVVQSIIAAEIGYEELALEYFLEAAYLDLADRHGNTADGVHVASAGGVWMALVNGFAGMRDHRGQLSFDPRLPAQWPSLAFRMQWRGSAFEVRITATAFEATLLSGEPVELIVRGRTHRLDGDGLRLGLDGRGPRLEGRPSLRRVTRHRREDGTPLSASVPPTAPLPVTDVEAAPIRGDAARALGADGLAEPVPRG